MLGGPSHSCRVSVASCEVDSCALACTRLAATSENNSGEELPVSLKRGLSASFIGFLRSARAVARARRLSSCLERSSTALAASAAAATAFVGVGRRGGSCSSGGGSSSPYGWNNSSSGGPRSAPLMSAAAAVVSAASRTRVGGMGSPKSWSWEIVRFQSMGSAVKHLSRSACKEDTEARRGAVSRPPAAERLLLLAFPLRERGWLLREERPCSSGNEAVCRVLRMPCGREGGADRYVEMEGGSCGAAAAGRRMLEDDAAAAATVAAAASSDVSPSPGAESALASLALR